MTEVDTMQRRHFLVKEVEGEYKLREIEAAIGEGIQRFGIITGRCHTVESIYWTFYFMHCQIDKDRANDIAEELTHDFLRGRR